MHAQEFVATVTRSNLFYEVRCKEIVGDVLDNLVSFLDDKDVCTDHPDRKCWYKRRRYCCWLLLLEKGFVLDGYT